MRGLLTALGNHMEDRLAAYGASAIMGAIAATPLGPALSAMTAASEFLESGGQAALDSIVSGQARSLSRVLPFRMQGIPILKGVEDALENIKSRRGRHEWQRVPWAKSRDDWLQNRWRHDWRSQPRNPAGGPKYWSGAWIPGRLDHPVPGATRIGKGKPTTSRKKRRINRYKRYGRIAARSYKFGGP